MTEILDRDDAFTFLDAFAVQAADLLDTPTECSLILRQHHLLRYVASSSLRAAVRPDRSPCR